MPSLQLKGQWLQMKSKRSFSRVFLIFLALTTAALTGCAATPAVTVDVDVPVATDSSGNTLPYLVVPDKTPDTGASAAPAPIDATPAQPDPAQTPVADPAQPDPTAAQPDPTAAQTPAQTQAPSAPVASGELPYYLYVEKESFTLTIYERDASGQYTQVYKTYRIAHGGNKTPAGTFELSSERERWHDFPDGGTAQYATLYKKHLYIHSPLYGGADPGMLWPKYYDGELGIGKASTGGCLRMVTEAAKFIYDNCPDGTILEIVNGAPRGTSSSDVPSRNGKRIDPTDEEGIKALG